ncbi:MAG: hypothetical protein IPM74_11025 [Crocinitomicaceae bacterium]|nr:hypothetical protein [Crocinitomicaceae bacterium]MBK8926416.1 hypothetical protein [Crocinitomicaceae bacterium]
MTRTGYETSSVTIQIVTYPNDSTIRYDTYDQEMKLINTRIEIFDGDFKLICQEFFDASGHLQVKRSYSFNSYGDCIQETTDASGWKREFVHEYTYDVVGNWLTKTSLETGKDQRTITSRKFIYY